MQEKKGFFKRLAEGLTKTILLQGLIIYSVVFPALMMIFMMKSKRLWSWGIWESMQLRPLLKS